MSGELAAGLRKGSRAVCTKLEAGAGELLIQEPHAAGSEASRCAGQQAFEAFGKERVSIFLCP